MHSDVPEKWELASLLGWRASCRCGAVHQVSLQEVIIEPGALSSVPECCARLLPDGALLLVADPKTFRLAGEGLLRDLRAHRDVSLFLLPAGKHGVVADDDTLRSLTTRLGSKIRGLVAVGAGTVNDVTKLASFRAGLPYVVCPTAPSMNGFTSGIAAIMSGGVKTTVPAHMPTAVIADLNVLASAPVEMMRAGVGDMLSKPVSNADWLLAREVRGEYYCQIPFGIVEAADRLFEKVSHAQLWSGPDGVRSLTEALLLSGISMVVAGSSSPASGGEHLMSHYWDMVAHRRGRPTGLHGAQVGVATLVTATLYEELLRLDPARIDWAALRRGYPAWAEVEAGLSVVHGSLAHAVVEEARKNWLPLPEREAEWQRIRDEWGMICQKIGRVLIPANELRQRLKRVGAPTTVRELGIEPGELRHAYLYARDIRGRYTVLDFAHDIGQLDSLCDAVLEGSGVLA